MPVNETEFTILRIIIGVVFFALVLFALTYFMPRKLGDP